MWLGLSLIMLQQQVIFMPKRLNLIPRIIGEPEPERQLIHPAWTSAWSFTTGNNLEIISPADNSGPYLPGIYFNFYRSGDYSNYVFQIDTSKNFNSTALVTRNIEDTFTNYYVEFREKTIKFKTVYYWRVKRGKCYRQQSLDSNPEGNHH
jgi:hypothetical protein